MVATPTLAEAARLADRQGWRVVLVGDPLQFLAVGRAGMFDWLVDHGPTIELDRVHRFAEPWEGDASLALRAGDVDALALYEQHGRLHAGESGEVDFDVIDHWAALRSKGESVAVLAANNDTVHRLNHLAQDHRIDVGELDPNGPSARTEAGYRLLVGDEIASRRNDRQLRTDGGVMVRNRDRWIVEHIAPDGSLVAGGRSGRVRLPADYVTDHVELAYAQTGHGAQGRTVDHALLIVDGTIDNRGVYVPLTRGRHSNHAYVALEPDDHRSARDVLGEAVNRDWADRPASVYRAQLDPVVSSAGPAAVPRPPLDPGALRRVAGELRRIDALGVPFWREGLQRELQHAEQARAAHQEAIAALDAAKTARDQAAGRLAALSPWNPFHARERRQVENDNRHANTAVARHRHRCTHTAEQLAHAEQRVTIRQDWLTLHEPDHQRRPGLQAELDRDRHARIDHAGQQPPPRWARHTLGTRPHQDERAELWDLAVGTVEHYRTIHAITGEHTAIGARPARSDPDFYQWAATAATLSHAAIELDREQHLDRHVRQHLGLDHDQSLGHGISL